MYPHNSRNPLIPALFSLQSFGNRFKGSSCRFLFGLVHSPSGVRTPSRLSKSSGKRLEGEWIWMNPKTHGGTHKYPKSSILITWVFPYKPSIFGVSTHISKSFSNENPRYHCQWRYPQPKLNCQLLEWITCKNGSSDVYSRVLKDIVSIHYIHFSVAYSLFLHQNIFIIIKCMSCLGGCKDLFYSFQYTNWYTFPWTKTWTKQTQPPSVTKRHTVDTSTNS